MLVFHKIIIISRLQCIACIHFPTSQCIKEEFHMVFSGVSSIVIVCTAITNNSTAWTFLSVELSPSQKSSTFFQDENGKCWPKSTGNGTNLQCIRQRRDVTHSLGRHLTQWEAAWPLTVFIDFYLCFWAEITFPSEGYFRRKT